MKYLIVGVLAMIVLLAVARPLIQSRTELSKRRPPSPMAARSLPAPEGVLGQESHTLDGRSVAPGVGYEPAAGAGAGATLELEPKVDFQAQVAKAQRVAAEDPKRAAQILKSWMLTDA
jgi:flagellar biosynthesis/type III secretory pathway M-ring protein FliF/YscJ